MPFHKVELILNPLRLLICQMIFSFFCFFFHSSHLEEMTAGGFVSCLKSETGNNPSEGERQNRARLAFLKCPASLHLVSLSSPRVVSNERLLLRVSLHTLSSPLLCFIPHFVCLGVSKHLSFDLLAILTSFRSTAHCSFKL